MLVFNNELFEKTRIKLKLSNKEVCKRAGITPGTLCTWKTGKNVPQGTNLTNVARVLNLKTSELLQAVESVETGEAELELKAKEKLDTVLLSGAAGVLEIRDALIAGNKRIPENERQELLNDTELYFKKLWKIISNLMNE